MFYLFSHSEKNSDSYSFTCWELTSNWCHLNWIRLFVKTQRDSRPAHRARETVELLRIERDTRLYSAGVFCGARTAQTYPVDYQIWTIMRYQASTALVNWYCGGFRSWPVHYRLWACSLNKGRLFRAHHVNSLTVTAYDLFYATGTLKYFILYCKST